MISPGRRERGRTSPTPADRRDLAADERDALAEQRDSAAAQRDRAAEQRDRAADIRDAEGSRRDALAERREKDADQRDRDADGAAPPASANPSPEAVSGAARARAEAAADRRGGRLDRRSGAAARSQAGVDRTVALADRGSGALDRVHAARDRSTAMTDRGASARERQSASLDSLTGVYLRGPGLVELEREMARARRTRQPLALAFVDVDRLKSINDSLGHAAGDRMLVEVANALKARQRSYDLVVRYGGDEFLCTISGLSMAAVSRRFALVNAALAKAPGHGSVAVGLAELQPGDSPAELIARADAALYLERDQLQGTRAPILQVEGLSRHDRRAAP